jgi:hypothetical protein
MQRAAFQGTNQGSCAAHQGQPWEEISFTYLEFLLSNGYVGDSMGRDIRFRLALHGRGNSELEIQIPTHLEEISVGESCKKMRGGSLAELVWLAEKLGIPSPKD